MTKCKYADQCIRFATGYCDECVWQDGNRMDLFKTYTTFKSEQENKIKKEKEIM